MEVATTITQHTIVLVVEKRERGIGMQALLSQAGFKVIMALSLYDALKYIAQEMPHLVITEAILADGSAGNLYDRLQQHEMLKKTPILAVVLKKTKEELAPLASRKFAGFFLGAFEPKSFQAKVMEVMKAHSSVSPYFAFAEQLGMEKELTLSIDANIVGRSGEQLVARSGTEVDSAASLLCVPNSQDLGPAVFRMATNLREGDEIFNMFPINRIVGTGRKWVLGLPEIKIGGDPAAKAEKMHKVIFYEPSEQRYEGFREIMKGYQIDLIHAKSLNMAASMVKRDFESISCVYLHELMNDASGIEWKNAYSKLPPNKRPPLIVGTTSMNARSQGPVRYIKRPFGMGLFVEMLQATFEKSADVALAAGKNSATSMAGVPVRYQAPASLVGVDETGGIIQVRFPILKGSRLNISHKFLALAWEGQTMVQITASAVLPSKPDIWHARFEAISAGMSKVKYWEKFLKHLATMAPAAPAPELVIKSA